MLNPGQPLVIDNDTHRPGQFVFWNTWEDGPFIIPENIIPDGTVKFHAHVSNKGIMVLTNLGETVLTIESEIGTPVLHKDECTDLPPLQTVCVRFLSRHSNSDTQELVKIFLQPRPHGKLYASLPR